MLSNKIRDGLSKFGPVLLYAVNVFVVMYAILAVMALGGYLLTDAGILEVDFYKDPLIGAIAAFIISFVVSLITTILSDRTFIRSIREMTAAMDELANGNFDAHIKLRKGPNTKDMNAFRESFNDTAKELRSVKMLRSDFINNFSHEFKTPIVSLRGFAELLKNEDLSAEQREDYLDIIITESTRLSTLATDVLNLSKIENQTILTDLAVFNMSEQIRHTVLMLERKWSRKTLNLDINLDEVNFYGNEELLSHVWVNLIDNAIKFSKEGGRLGLELIDLPDEVVFRISDEGLGMDAETQAHIFDKFYQAEEAKSIGGNGLGLAIVNKVVTLSKGEIAVESQPGLGTQITVTLPKLAQKRNGAVAL